MNVSCEITIERDGIEIELTVEGTPTPAEPDVGIMSAGVELGAVLLDGRPWPGELTEAEVVRAEDALCERVDDAYAYDDDDWESDHDDYDY